MLFFVSLCKTPEPKLRGKFLSRRFVKRRECVFDHTIIIHYVMCNFVPHLSQVLQLGHTVSANSVSLDGLVHPAVQLRPADVQLVT